MNGAIADGDAAAVVRALPRINSAKRRHPTRHGHRLGLRRPSVAQREAMRNANDGISTAQISITWRISATACSACAKSRCSWAVRPPVPETTALLAESAHPRPGLGHRRGVVASAAPADQRRRGCGSHGPVPRSLRSTATSRERDPVTRELRCGHGDVPVRRSTTWACNTRTLSAAYSRVMDTDATRWKPRT